MLLAQCYSDHPSTVEKRLRKRVQEIPTLSLSLQRSLGICFASVVLLVSPVLAEQNYVDVDCSPEKLAERPEGHPHREMCAATQDDKNDEAANNGKEYSGEWVNRDGELVCDGYLMRKANEDFCSATVPDDWKPFWFNGKTYYVQPLN